MRPETSGRGSGAGVHTPERAAPPSISTCIERCGWGFDLAVLTALLAIGVLFHLGRWRGERPFFNLTSDAANISSFVAARMHPELFERDALLGDPAHSRIYWNLQIPMVQGLFHLTGDLGTPFLATLWLHVVVQGVAFYALGRVLFRSRLWAAMLALVSLVPAHASIGMRFGEAWGVFLDPIPRFTFQALLPLVMILAHRWRREPRRWPLLAAMSGLFAYVHVSSTPAWALAIWCGFLPFLPSSWARARRAGVVFGLCALFLAIAAPCAIRYLGSHTHGTTSAYEQIWQLLRIRHGAGLTDLPRSLASELYWGLVSGRLLLLAAGARAMWSWAPERRDELRLLGAWLAGILVASALLPLVDHGVASMRRALPLQIDMVRGIRYVQVFVLIGTIWPLAELDRRQLAPCARLVLLGALLLFVVTRGRGQYLTRLVFDQLKAMAAGRSYPDPGADRDRHEGLMAIARLVPTGEPVLPIGGPVLEIRYGAWRPVAHAAKDGSMFGYSDHAALARWSLVNDRVRAMEARPAPQQVEPAVRLARELGARWISISGLRPDAAPPPGVRIAYSNTKLTLLAVTDAP